MPKLKIWNSETKEMTEVDSFDDLSGQRVDSVFRPTDLKDKNQADIYEGAAVQFTANIVNLKTKETEQRILKGQVIWVLEQWMIYVPGYADIFKLSNYQVEVIDHMAENPKALEVT